VAEFGDERWMADMRAVFREHCRDRRTLVFCPSRDVARRLQRDLRHEGFDVEHADGAMSAHERERALGRFERGDAIALTSVDILGEGYDVPAADCCLMGRPTQSTTIYLQQAGRVLRPNAAGRKSLILDCVGNTARVGGGPKVPRRWTLKGLIDERKERREKAAEEAAAKRRELQERNTRLVAISEDVTVEIKPNVAGTGWSRQSVHAAVRRCRDANQVHALGRRLGYHGGWAAHMCSLFRIPEDAA